MAERVLVTAATLLNRVRYDQELRFKETRREEGRLQQQQSRAAALN